jgi:flagellar protein FliJ
VKGLPNLIRLHRWRLDEKRKTLSELERLGTDLRQQALRLEDELKQEQQTAARSPEEAGYAYGRYAGRVIARRQAIAASLAEVKAKITQAAAAVTESFRELKRFEIAQERRERAEFEKEAKAERSILDEMGLQAHRKDAAR